MFRLRSTPRPARPRRRGTIIILVVGILAVLSVATVSYMTVVRLDRSSTFAYANSLNYKQQVNAVTGHIRALLTADLFGNKMVTSTVPESLQQAQVWPRAFEDGDFADYPSVDEMWLDDPEVPDPVPTNHHNVLPLETITLSGSAGNAGSLLRYRLARPDDAWLSPSEPVDARDDDGVWDSWPQVTNLRSAYLWDDDLNDNGFNDGPNDAAWVRDHGRFIDIAEWFVKSQGDPLGLPRADPGLDASLFNNAAWPNALGAGDSQQFGPRLGVDDVYAGDTGGLGIDLSVFPMQMSRMEDFLDGAISNPDDPADFLNADSRLFADADGDGRADSRWQQLDSLGELYGLKWLVAARIIDNGAMINANASLEFHHPDAAEDEAGSAATPADIDLYRLLRRASTTWAPQSAIHPDVEASNIDAPFFEQMWSAHRLGHLSLPDAFETLDDEFMLGLTQTSAADLNSTDHIGRAEKRAFYRYFGSAPYFPQVGSITAAPLGDEVDLRAYWGFNYSAVVSKVEQRFDGVDEPGNNNPQGFLPNQSDWGGGQPSDAVGPLRSRENERALRTFRDFVVGAAAGSGTYLNDPGVNDPTNNSPDGKIVRIQRDLRRHITTYNGVSRLAPGAPWNPAGPAASSYSAFKVPVGFPWRLPVAAPADLAAAKEAVQGSVIAAFDSFMSALAPLALDIPVYPGVVYGSAASSTPDAYRSSNFHYGGGATGPAALSVPPITDASYATLRALSLAVNLADAIDHDGDGSTESPTVAWFHDRDDPLQPTATRASREIELSPNLLAGRIPNTSLSASVMGGPGLGIGIVGLDRQPFLVEVNTFCGYLTAELADSQGSPGIINAIIDPAEPKCRLGSIVSVELGNPWPEPIDAARYSLRLIDNAGTRSITLRLGRLEEAGARPHYPSNAPESTSVIAPGSTKTFVYIHNPASDAGEDTIQWELMLAEWLTEMADTRGLAVGDRMAFLRSIDSAGDGSTPISLERFNVLFDDVILQEFGTAAASPSDVQALLLYMDEDPNASAVIRSEYVVDRMRHNGSGEFPRIMAPLQQFVFSFGAGVGRAGVSGSLYRRSEPPADGFPSYVVESPTGNLTTSFEFRQWWRTSGAMPLPAPASLADLMDEILYPAGAIDHNFLGLPKGSLADFAPTQLFVPDGPLRSTAELLLLCPFAHTYVFSNPTEHFLARTGAHLTNWTTVSEYLGKGWHLYRDWDGSSGTVPNPYVACLDPTRFVLRDAANGSSSADLDGVSINTNYSIPASLTIPLALRVPDNFVALSGPEDILSGVVNVNTAPLEVLECIPLLAPEREIFGLTGMTDGVPQWDPSMAASRAELLRDYRDLKLSSGFDRSNPDARAALTMIPGLRQALEPISALNTRGLVTTAEAALLSQWDAMGAPTIIPATAASGLPYEDFAWVAGSDTSNINQTLGPGVTARYGGANLEYLEDYDQVGGVDQINRQAFVTDFNPIDDAEERLALARPLFDLASTRSDVFTAWFVLRAYDPEQIEAIQVLTGDDRARAALLNEQIAAANPSPGLTPVYESRWLAVLDRSEVRRPTDRPRVLLLVELPVN